jgi:hypothetical protein
MVGASLIAVVKLMLALAHWEHRAEFTEPGAMSCGGVGESRNSDGPSQTTSDDTARRH